MLNCFELCQVDVEYQASIRQLTEINDKWIIEWRAACDVRRPSYWRLTTFVVTSSGHTNSWTLLIFSEISTIRGTTNRLRWDNALELRQYHLQYLRGR
jgi:hypothetical protein